MDIKIYAIYAIEDCFNDQCLYTSKLLLYNLIAIIQCIIQVSNLIILLSQKNLNSIIGSSLIIGFFRKKERKMI